MGKILVGNWHNIMFYRYLIKHLFSWFGLGWYSPELEDWSSDLKPKKFCKRRNGKNRVCWEIVPF